MQTGPILVVGATGTVGSALMSQLVEAGQSVRALVRDPVKARNKLGEGVDLAVADLAKPESLAATFAGIDKVFILAPPVSNLEELEANALAAAEQAGVGHVVYLSNFGAGTFDEDLWRVHGANEQRLRKLNLAWTILRPVRFMSNTPYGWFSVRERGRLVEPHGGRKVTLIDPRDIAAAAAIALTTSGHENKTYELVGEALTGTEMARCLSNALHRPIGFVDASEDEVRDDLLRSGLPPVIAEKVLYYFKTLRDGRWYETSTLADLLGKTPRKYADWLQDYPPPS
jgi:uncharacterized protein YbjT (DUF2867 family)